MTAERLRVLLVEDSEEDAELLLRRLASAGFAPDAERVETAGAMEAALRRESWDIALLDYRLPGFSGPGALALVRDLGLDLPCIIVSGTIDEDSAVTALKAGAADFVLKDNLTRLGPAIVREVREARNRAAHRTVEHELTLRDRELRTLVEHVPDVIARIDRDLRIQFVNPAATDELGLPSAQVNAIRLMDNAAMPGVAPHMLERWRAAVQSVLDTGEPATVELDLSAGTGRRVLQTRIVAEHREGAAVTTVLSIGRDVTAAKELEEDRSRLLASERAARADAEAAIQRLASMLESIGDAFLALDRDWRVTYANQETIRTIGEALGLRTVDDLLGKRLWDVLPDEVGRLVRPEYERSMREGAKGHIENYFEVLHSWLQANIYPAPGGLSVFFRDVTELKEAEEALRRSEEHFRSLFEYITDVITLLDAEGRILYQSPSAKRVFGREASEYIGCNAFELVHPADLPHLQEAFLQGSSVGDVQAPVEYRVRNVHGEWVHVESTGTNLLDNPAVGALVVHTRDVGERYAAQQQARFQAALLEIVGQAVIATDLQGLITYWNHAATAVYGWTPAEVLGLPIADVMSPPGGPEVAEELLKSLQRGEPWSGEIDVRAKDGRLFTVYNVDSPLLDDAGQLAGFVGASTDLTERKALEGQIRQGQKMEAIGQLAGGVAHDFNNLLTAIKGNVDFLLGELPPLSPSYGDAEEIRKAANQATALTRQLLAFGRRQVLNPIDLELNELVTELERMLRRLIGERIRLRTELEPGETTVHADAGQIQQVIVNLVVNARDAMPEGGDLLLRTSEVDWDPGTASSVEEPEPGRFVRFTVSDSGCGIPADALHRIFEPFFTTKETGTGLGLATVYGIVTQSGGAIRVESEMGQGSSFHVYLPRVQAPSIDAQPPQPAVPVAGNRRPSNMGKTILLVEDEAPVRAVAARALRNRGFTVVEASCGEEALALLAEVAIVDLMITDVVMPDMSGPVLADHALDRRPGLRVLFVSGYAAEEVDFGARLVGQSFLQKPFTPTSLVHRVQGIIGDPRTDPVEEAHQ